MQKLKEEFSTNPDYLHFFTKVCGAMAKAGAFEAVRSSSESSPTRRARRLSLCLRFWSRWRSERQ